jgi:hypothetical protein
MFFFCGSVALQFVHDCYDSSLFGCHQDATAHRTPLNFSDYVFRVCPMLNYRQVLGGEEQEEVTVVLLHGAPSSLLLFKPFY